MDPDRALARIVELAERIVNGALQGLEWADVVPSAEELAEAVLSLDDWLRRGGFRPEPWQTATERESRRALPTGSI